jgi:hypothetical protein
MLLVAIVGRGLGSRIGSVVPNQPINYISSQCQVFYLPVSEAVPKIPPRNPVLFVDGTMSTYGIIGTGLGGSMVYNHQDPVMFRSL